LAKQSRKEKRGKVNEEIRGGEKKGESCLIERKNLTPLFRGGKRRTSIPFSPSIYIGKKGKGMKGKEKGKMAKLMGGKGEPTKKTQTVKEAPDVV